MLCTSCTEIHRQKGTSVLESSFSDSQYTYQKPVASGTEMNFWVMMSSCMFPYISALPLAFYYNSEQNLHILADGLFRMLLTVKVF